MATTRATSTTNGPAPQSSRWRATLPWWPLPGTSLVSKVWWILTPHWHFGLSIVQFHPTLTSNNITHSYTCPCIPMIYPIISSPNIHRLLLQVMWCCPMQALEWSSCWSPGQNLKLGGAVGAGKGGELLTYDHPWQMHSDHCSNPYESGISCALTLNWPWPFPVHGGCSMTSPN